MARRLDPHRHLLADQIRLFGMTNHPHGVILRGCGTESAFAMAPSATSVATELAQRFVAQDHLRDALGRQTITQGNTQVVDRLAAVAAVESFEPGEVLIHQGRTDTDILLILAGNVIVSPNGRDDTTRGVHNHVGEMATIDPAVRRSATVRASEPTVIGRVREGDFSEIANDHPFLWRRLAMELAERLRQRASGVKIRKCPTRNEIG
jgi:CRP-like cAMP-binding protein